MTKPIKQKRPFRIAVITIALILVGGCVSTSVTSYTDPAYSGSSFRSVAVWANTIDLEWREDLESGMQERVNTTTGARAIRMIDIASPTRDYDVTEMYQLVRGAGAEAVIVVSFTDTGVTQSVSGNQYGVYTTQAPWAQAEVGLYDVESGVKVWTGIAKTAGDAFTDWEAVRQSAGSEVVEDILSSGLLPRPAND